MSTVLSEPASSSSPLVPELAVFDLDECLYHPEMYTLRDIPCEPVHGDLGGGYGVGVIGVRSGKHTIVSIIPSALKVLQHIYEERIAPEGAYKNMRLAAASSADTNFAANCGRAALRVLEVVPGLTVDAFFAQGHLSGGQGHMQIGRSPPLSADKKTHFTQLQKHTGVAFNRMVFFDDCNWGDNCGRVARACPGVITQETPSGATLDEWHTCLRNYAAAATARADPRKYDDSADYHAGGGCAGSSGDAGDAGPNA